MLFYNILDVEANSDLPVKALISFLENNQYPTEESMILDVQNMLDIDNLNNLSKLCIKLVPFFDFIIFVQIEIHKYLLTFF